MVTTLSVNYTKNLAMSTQVYLDTIERCLQNKSHLLDFMGRMLQRELKRRQIAQQLLDHPWFHVRLTSTR